jgi:predicted RNA binding protein YcfA (HicA-like mRNA interferase family)
LTRLHPVRARDVILFLASLGFAQIRQKGSHKFFRHSDGRTATIPDHRGEDLGRGILAKVLRDAETRIEDFLSWLSR